MRSGEAFDSDQIEQMQNDFRNEFSQSTNKAEIIHAIAQLLQASQKQPEKPAQASTESIGEEDPLRHLKNELERAFIAFKDNFSIYRAMGEEDPEDEAEDVSDDNSIVLGSVDEDPTATFKLDQSEKNTMSNNLLKIIKMSVQKQRLFHQIMSDWKYESLKVKHRKVVLVHKTLFNLRQRMTHRTARAFGALRLTARLRDIEQNNWTPVESANEDEQFKEGIFESKFFDNGSDAGEKNGKNTVELESKIVENGVKKEDNASQGVEACNLGPAILPGLSQAQYLRLLFLNLQRRNCDWAFFNIMSQKKKNAQKKNTLCLSIKDKLLMALRVCLLLI